MDNLGIVSDDILKATQKLNLSDYRQLIHTLSENQEQIREKTISKWKKRCLELGLKMGLSEADMTGSVAQATKSQKKKRAPSIPRYINPENPAQTYSPKRHEAQWFRLYVDSLAGLSSEEITKKMKAITNPQWLETRAAKQMPLQEHFLIPKRSNS